MLKLLVPCFILASIAFAQEAVQTEVAVPGEIVVDETVPGNVTTGSEAQTPAGETTPAGCMGFGGGGITGLLPIVAMVAIFYFLIIRPQQKQQKQLKLMRGNLQKGDKVVTSGGIHGVISNLKSDVITVKIADSVKIDVDRSSLTVLRPENQIQESN